MAIRAVASTATLLAVLAAFGLLLNDMGSISALPIVAAGLAVLVIALVLFVQLASRQTTRNHHQH